MTAASLSPSSNRGVAYCRKNTQSEAVVVHKSYSPETIALIQQIIHDNIKACRRQLEKLERLRERWGDCA